MSKRDSKKIVSKKADYLLAVKGNQPTLLLQIKEFFTHHRKIGFRTIQHDFNEEVYEGHGRVEIRKHWVSSHIDWLACDKEWMDLKAIGVIESTRTIGDKSTTQMRYYISSVVNLKAKNFGLQVRSHWSIENNLHWIMDVSFGDDASRNRKDNSAANLHLVRQIAFNIIKLSAKQEINQN